MDRTLAVILFILAFFVMFFAYPAGPLAVLFGAVCAIVAINFINRSFTGDEQIFLRRLFIIALMLRVVLATVTYVFELQHFFGGDSITYDRAGNELQRYWFGYASEATEYHEYYLGFATRGTGSGFGMAYIVAVIYSVVGRNPLAIQLFNSVLGAATACLIYVCAQKVFSNNRVAKVAAVLVGVFPSLVLWSSQGLKDGIICFLLALAINNLLSLQKKFNYNDVALLLVALIGIYTLRFYIFFAFTVAIVGAYFISTQKSVSSIAKQTAVLVVITLGLTYLGVLRNAQENIDTYSSLESLQNSRIDQARNAESGFGQDFDVSTPSGALQVLPLGLTYLMLAPFPWEVRNFRQLMTLPEVLLWWALVPFLVSGVWYTLNNKLRSSIAIILLTLLLTISYAIFQGNVGTAYRMRAQMLIFYFIFIAVGLTTWQEKRENNQLARKIGKQRMMQQAFIREQNRLKSFN